MTWCDMERPNSVPAGFVAKIDIEDLFTQLPGDPDVAVLDSE